MKGLSMPFRATTFKEWWQAASFRFLHSLIQRALALRWYYSGTFLQVLHTFWRFPGHPNF